MLKGATLLQVLSVAALVAAGCTPSISSGFYQASIYAASNCDGSAGSATFTSTVEQGCDCQPVPLDMNDSTRSLVFDSVSNGSGPERVFTAWTDTGCAGTKAGHSLFVLYA
jgi:hypothetical protein